MSHPNEEALRSAGEAIAKGDFDGFLSHYTDDVVVHYPGTSSLAGEYRGKEAFMGMFARFGEITGGPPQIEVHDTLANDTHGVVLQTVRIQRKGRTVDAQQVIVSHFRDGKVSELWPSYLDQHEVDDLLS